MAYTAVEKLTCAEREVNQRERVYARLVAAGKMSAKKAEYETAVMRAIAEDYRQETDLFARDQNGGLL